MKSKTFHHGRCLVRHSANANTKNEMPWIKEIKIDAATRQCCSDDGKINRTAKVNSFFFLKATLLARLDPSLKATPCASSVNIVELNGKGKIRGAKASHKRQQKKTARRKKRTMHQKKQSKISGAQVFKHKKETTKKRIAATFDRSIDATAITGNHCAVSYAKSSLRKCIDAKIESNGFATRIQSQFVQQLNDRSTDHISKKTLSLCAFFRSVFVCAVMLSHRKRKGKIRTLTITVVN